MQAQMSEIPANLITKYPPGNPEALKAVGPAALLLDARGLVGEYEGGELGRISSDMMMVDGYPSAPPDVVFPCRHSMSEQTRSGTPNKNKMK